MTYRNRQRLFNLIVAGPLFTLIGVLAWWVFSTDNSTATAQRGSALLVLLAVLVGFLHYWPTRRRPTNLYHLTTSIAAQAATTAKHDDGTVTVVLQSRRGGRKTYFFPHPPVSSGHLYWNLRHRPNICIELVDIHYDDVRVRRRITGADQLSGLPAARARIHRVPPDA